MKELIIHAEQFEEAMRFAEQQSQHTAAWNAAQSVLKPAAAAAATGMEMQTQAELLHDVIGNPFCSITIDPRWRSSPIVDLAQAIYDERAFDRMPILADALMDASCDNEEIIAHCRGAGPHVRGCWVVDLLLGKE